MKERPILFNTAMVQAILSGCKTQTRRGIAKELGPRWFFETPPVFGKITSPHRFKGRFGVFIKRGINTDFPECDLIPCPFGEVGDRLWVRESFRLFNSSNECGCSESPCGCPRNGTPIYRATHDDGESKWKPSIHMPRSACRIILEITGLRVERLHDISEADASAEGCDNSKSEAAIAAGWYEKPIAAFRRVWEQTGGDWNANPWVWVIEFKVLTTNGIVPEVGENG